ncbi:MAG: multicopper oxidase domain-containing protein, partial [Pseudomonadota bacterium]
GYIPWVQGKSPTVPLPIPPLADGSNGTPLDLNIQTGLWSFKPGVLTPTLGISQNYLGPTIRTRQHSLLNLNYHNSLNEKVAIHGHGLHVPGDVDGGPQLAIEPGEKWTPELSIVQPAATCWYHSHTHGKTGEQVYHGLAGMIIIDDELTESLALPGRYGVDDLPIIIQDRTFNAEGGLVYSLQDSDEDGWLGETVVINGAMAPFCRVPAGKIRLRILNGSNARFYFVGFSDNREFHKIACDGGLLEKPVTMKMMEMAPGERCEIVVDMSDGKMAELLTIFEDDFEDDVEDFVGSVISLFTQSDKTIPLPALTLMPDHSLQAHIALLPEQLASIDRPKPDEIAVTRDFVLEMSHADKGDTHNEHQGHGHMNMTINGAAMDMNVINERVKRGVWERWRVRADQGAHPFHVHGCSFLIEQMEGGATPPDQRGWKDTIVLDDDDWSEMIVRFNHLATDQHPYMYHCHILEHEDQGMMGQFTVS